MLYEVITEGVTDEQTEADRDKIIKENIANIKKEASEGNDYIVNVQSFRNNFV